MNKRYKIKNLWKQEHQSLEEQEYPRNWVLIYFIFIVK